MQSFKLNSFYRGRFAPSPTGDLHFGSLVAAVASYCRARSQNGEWLIRLEDIDPLREVAGSFDSIMKTLAMFGLHSDAPVVCQSKRRDLYWQALHQLRQRDLVFACDCTRSELGAENLHRGACRRVVAQSLPHRIPTPAGENKLSPTPAQSDIPSRGKLSKENARQPSWRLRVPSVEVAFNDLVQGPVRQYLAEEVGDFVVWRVDDWVAYQLAVVIDDADQGISEIVRGADLMDSTPRQIHLQSILGFTTPSYAHVPLALDSDGAKLSKSIASLPIANEEPLPALRAALRFLGQTHLSDASTFNVKQLLQLACRDFQIEQIPKTPQKLAVDFKSN